MLNVLRPYNVAVTAVYFNIVGHNPPAVPTVVD